MRVLIIKLSSMGDILHTLPALTDATHINPGIVFDWVVEEGFAEIPTWHPSVHTIIPIALRRWRFSPFSALWRGEISQFLRDLRNEHYDLIIDPQGLIKSAILALLAHGPISGFAKSCVRESWARFAYSRKVAVPKETHAIARIRGLFSRAFGYELPSTPPDYGISLLTETPPNPEKYLVFLHGTSRAHKAWPLAYWQALAALADTAGYRVKLSFGSDAEKESAFTIAQGRANVDVLDKMSLRGVAGLLMGARGVVAVDTGLGHLTAALGVPCVSLYGPTSPELTGALGQDQIHLHTGGQSLETLRPEMVWQQLYALLSRPDLQS